ncbi:MAG: cytochrome c oxidase subunit 2A [Deinococcales bacterium]
MRDDEPAVSGRVEGRRDSEYRPWGALAVTAFLAAVILGLWFLVFALSQLRG